MSIDRKRLAQLLGMRFGAIERGIDRLDARMSFMQWQIGGLIALQVAIGGPALWLMLRMAAKIGALG